MSAEEIKEKIRHIVDRMNATGMDTLQPVEMSTLRRELVILYNKSSQLSNWKKRQKFKGYEILKKNHAIFVK